MKKNLDIYKLCKSVYLEKMTLKAAKKIVLENKLMNINSSNFYFPNFKNLVEGKKFSGNLSAAELRLFVSKIKNDPDFGYHGLICSLKSIDLYLEYKLKKGFKLNKIRKVYEDYSSSIDLIDENEEWEQGQFLKSLKKEKPSKKALIQKIKDSYFNADEKNTTSRKVYKRNNKAIALIKYLRGFKCQICEKSIQKKDGSFYIEAAHIKPKHKGGNETLDNILILCPNCHKEFDYSNRVIIEKSNTTIKFLLNDIYHVIEFYP